MKKYLLITTILLTSLFSNATIHEIRVWDGYLQFLPSNLTIQLGDTIHWLPLDPPSMTHTVTSTNIPAGAAPFDVIWQLPADTFFQYVPAVTGMYEYECTPHVTQGMTGSFLVEDSLAGIGEIDNLNALVFPNPGNGIITIQNAHEYTRLKVFDTYGTLMETIRVKENADLRHLSSGVYFLLLEGTKNRSVRFVKE